MWGASFHALNGFKYKMWGHYNLRCEGYTTIRVFTHTHTHSIRIFLDLDTLTHATLIYSHTLMNSRTHNLNNSLVHLHTYTDLCTYVHTLSIYLQSEYITSHSSMYQRTVRRTEALPETWVPRRIRASPPHSDMKVLQEDEAHQGWVQGVECGWLRPSRPYL